MLLPEPKVLYKRLVKRAFIGALQTVFTQEYPDDPVLRDLNVSGDFNIKQFKTPQLIVNYQGTFTENVGVGHQEIWVTDNGLEKHMRFRWEGVVNFELYTLSPLDRDAFFDALTELVAFGRLDTLMSNFFDYLYNHDFGIDAQIMINLDSMRDRGDGNEQAWWQPEDVMLFTGGFSMDCHGTFASVVRDKDLITMIDKIIVYPYIFGYEDAPDPAPFEVLWQGTNNTEDYAYVKGEGVLSAVEG